MSQDNFVGREGLTNDEITQRLDSRRGVICLWLREDAIRRWQHRCWIFPRDAQFASKASRLLDLYHRTWQGQALSKDEFVLSADEKTSIQARSLRHATLHSAWGRDEGGA